MHQQKNIIYLLASLLLFGLVMVLARVYITNSKAYLFLFWNDFLACIPLFISYYLQKKNIKLSAKFVLLASLVWLLFLPNAAYLITDFLHLGENTLIAKWIDVSILFTNSFTCLLIGMVSIIWMAEVWRQFLTANKVNFLVFASCMASGFGIYLGRFLRWNSWDVLQNPFGLFAESIFHITHPATHLSTWGVTIILGVLQFLVLLFLKVWQNSATINIKNY